MWVSEREAAAIYAKAATKWYGPRAQSPSQQLRN
jgi:hypothetical protein